MSKLILETKKITDLLNKTESKIVSNIKDILKSVNSQSGGVIIEIPWGITLDDNYMESITIVAVKVTKDRIYFINPVKVSLEPIEIKDGEDKGPARIVHQNGLESFSLIDFIKMSREKSISGLLRE